MDISKRPPSRFDCYTSLDEVPEQTFDAVCVCTKSFDSPRVAESLKQSQKRLPIRAIVLCQNGIGNYETFCEHFSAEMVFNARVITGFCRPKPNESCVTVHSAPIHVGQMEGHPADALAFLCDAITEGGIECRLTDTIGHDVWAKLLYNALLNPLGAIFNVPYGRLVETESSREIMARLGAEIFEIMDRLEARTHWKTIDEYRDAFYSAIVPPTYDHESSMLQDIRARRRTEIDAINGAVVRLAEKLGIEVPFNRMLVLQIKYLEWKTATGSKSG